MYECLQVCIKHTPRDKFGVIFVYPGVGTIFACARPPLLISMFQVGKRGGCNCEYKL